MGNHSPPDLVCKGNHSHRPEQDEVSLGNHSLPQSDFVCKGNHSHRLEQNPKFSHTNSLSGLEQLVPGQLHDPPPGRPSDNGSPPPPPFFGSNAPSPRSLADSGWDSPAGSYTPSVFCWEFSSPNHPLGEDEQPSVLTSTTVTGNFPAHPLTCLFPLEDASEEDDRLPLDPSVLPRCIEHKRDERGENFIVRYAVPTRIKGSHTPKKSVWYRCCSAKCKLGSAEQVQGHCRAEKLAWAHIEAVLSKGADASRVIPKFGFGEVSPQGRIRYHGDPNRENTFTFHPRKPGWCAQRFVVWNPCSDTLCSQMIFAGTQCSNVASPVASRNGSVLGTTCLLRPGLVPSWNCLHGADPCKARHSWKCSAV